MKVRNTIALVVLGEVMIAAILQGQFTSQAERIPTSSVRPKSTAQFLLEGHRYPRHRGLNAGLGTIERLLAQSAALLRATESSPIARERYRSQARQLYNNLAVIRAQRRGQLSSPELQARFDQTLHALSDRFGFPPVQG